MPPGIFYLITDLDAGGAERALYRLATAPGRSQYRVKVGCLTGHGEVGAWLERAGIEVFHCGMRGWRDLPALRRLTVELRRWRPDILHCFLFHANIAGRIAGRMAKVPFIINSVRVEEQRRSHLIADRFTHRFMDMEVCVSESARRFTAEHAGIPETKLHVVPNGVDLDEFDASSQTPAVAKAMAGKPADLPIKEGDSVVASVGRLEKQKDYPTLLCAARILLRERPATTFVVAGDGSLRQALLMKSVELGISDKVLFLGRVPDVRPLLARCDVFALASRWEGMPNALLEAMAFSRPVVATDVGGCREVVDNGVSGYLVAPRNARAFAERLRGILDDSRRAAAMGQAGRAIVERKYGLRRTHDAWLAVYRRALDSVAREDREKS